MKRHVLVIGSGLAGLSCALSLARDEIRTTLISPYPSERAQSVMAAGGINAATGADDTPALHAEDTMRGGCHIADPVAVRGMCEAAPDIIAWLDALGTVFDRDENARPARRAFGGQSRDRTVYAGASTGKQIMSALIREARRYERSGMIVRRLGLHFHSALIRDGICFGAMLFDERAHRMEAVYADAVVMATGGQNVLFGKTTGSTQCDGYAAAKLFEQGVQLKNLEFIQYHPTTVETPQKRMLISEAARGEGGRLYYLDGDRRVYFMEDKYGPRGNLMARDIVAKGIYDAPSQVYLDIAPLGKQRIDARLGEIVQVCDRYLGLDVHSESIPVAPSVHFFMGGIAVDRDHKTCVDRLYAIGECAAIYHGANRLGGNSLLAAIYGGRIAARDIAAQGESEACPDFTAYIENQEALLRERMGSMSRFSAVHIRQEIAALMNDCLGITRCEEKLQEGIRSIEYYLSVSDKLAFDSDVSPYIGYSLRPMLILARAILTCAAARRETRGAHIREDYPQTEECFRCATLIDYDNGTYRITMKQEEQA